MFKSLLSAPDVSLLLEIDREYREKAAAGSLHARFGPWRFTALYSSAEQADGPRRVSDWVVICFDEGGRDDEGQATVVTEWRGDLKGLRVVRGREPECATHYRALARLAA